MHDTKFYCVFIAIKNERFTEIREILRIFSNLRNFNERIGPISLVRCFSQRARLQEVEESSKNDFWIESFSQQINFSKLVEFSISLDTNDFFLRQKIQWKVVTMKIEKALCALYFWRLFVTIKNLGNQILSFKDFSQSNLL